MSSKNTKLELRLLRGGDFATGFEKNALCLLTLIAFCFLPKGSNFTSKFTTCILLCLFLYRFYYATYGKKIWSIQNLSQIKPPKSHSHSMQNIEFWNNPSVLKTQQKICDIKSVTSSVFQIVIGLALYSSHIATAHSRILHVNTAITYTSSSMGFIVQLCCFFNVVHIQANGHSKRVVCPYE